MKPANSLMMVMTAVALLSVAACSRKVAAVSKPANIAPVAATSPQPAPAKAKTVAATTATRQNAAPPSRQTTMPAAVRETLNQRLARLDDALFDYDKATIRADASRPCSRMTSGVVRDILANYPSQKLVIEGYADERGSSEYNLALGDRRAHAALRTF